MSDKEKSLIEHATGQGAELDVEEKPSDGEFGDVRGIREILPGKVEFYTELPRVNFDKLIGKRFIIRNARLISEWQGFYGTSDFYLLMVELADKTQCTTLAGGTAILNQLRKLTRMRGGLPVVVRLVEVDGTSGKYKIFE